MRSARLAQQPVQPVHQREDGVSPGVDCGAVEQGPGETGRPIEDVGTTPALDERAEQLQGDAEGEIGLELGSSRGRDRDLGLEAVDEGLQQHGLADPRRALDHHDTSLASHRRPQRIGEGTPLLAPLEQPLCPVLAGRAVRHGLPRGYPWEKAVVGRGKACGGGH